MWGRGAIHITNFLLFLLYRNLTLVPEEDEGNDHQQHEEHKQTDIITGLPYELALYVFSLLCFDELAQVQLVRPQKKKEKFGSTKQEFSMGISLCLLSHFKTCRLWCRIARDPSLWKFRCLSITQKHSDLSSIHDDMMDYMDDDRLSQQRRLVRRQQQYHHLPWPTRYCRLQTRLNWKLGAVQRVHLISELSGSRILSVKLKEKLLVVLSEVSSCRWVKKK